MKSFLKIFAIGGVCLIAVSAQSLSPSKIRTKLVAFHVSPKWGDLQNLKGGSVVVDGGSNQVVLTLIHSNSNEDVVTTLPIIKIRTEICNIKIVEAKRDRKSTDGPVETIVVQDNSAFNCEKSRVLPPTRVTYTEEGGWTKSVYAAEFEGDTLSEVTGAEK